MGFSKIPFGWAYLHAIDCKVGKVFIFLLGLMNGNLPARL